MKKSEIIKHILKTDVEKWSHNYFTDGLTYTQYEPYKAAIIKRLESGKIYIRFWLGSYFESDILITQDKRVLKYYDSVNLHCSCNYIQTML